MCGSGVDVASSLLLISAILMAVGEQPFHLSRCPNFRNRLTQRRREIDRIYDYRYSVLPLVLAKLLSNGRLVEDELHGLGEDKLGWIQRCSAMSLER